MAQAELTKILANWTKAGRDGLDAAFPIVYHELHRLARHHLAGTERLSTLQPTLLVHEAYLRLATAQPREFQSRSHFFAYVSRVIRHVLVDLIRSRRSRGSEETGDPESRSEMLESAMRGGGLSPDLLLAVHESLQHLESLDGRQARIIEMKFFGGMKHTEIAENLGISLASVERHWSVGRRRLALFLQSPAQVEPRPS